jgi:hypothetical protein
VPSASNTVSPPCTHERRPGTTVCLLCRQEARVAASERRKKLLLRGTALAIVVAVIALGLSSAAIFRGRAAAREEASAEPAASAKVATTPPPSPDSVIPQGGQAPAPTAIASTATAPTATAAVPSTTTPPAAAIGPAAPVAKSDAAAKSDVVLAPTIKVGDTPLGGGAIATRNDSGVAVVFDTPDLRTRTPQKFESFLRATLSQIYGPRIDRVLASLPAGKIVGQGDLVYDLPTRGIQLPVQPGWHLEVYPEIRPGRDGPLVVRYRAIVAKD